jgi:hypothetical protein
MKTTRPSEKLDHQRLDPFFIVKQINVMVFQFKLPGSMKIHPMFHVFVLEPYHMSTIPRRIHDPPPSTKVDGEQKYEMKDVLDSMIFNHRL